MASRTREPLARRSIGWLAALAVVAIAGTTITVPSDSAHATSGDVTVRVIRDFNANGKWDPTLPRLAGAGSPDQVNEPGVAGIVVELLDAAGKAMRATTDVGGIATFHPDGTLTGEKFRAEASIPSSMSFLQPAIVNSSVTGPDALSPLTTTVDASNGANRQVTMGVWNPADYTGDNPTLVTSVGWGNWDGVSAERDRAQSVVAFNYNDGGPNSNGQTWNQANLGAIGGNLAAQMAEIGSTWGLAARSTSEIYAAAVNKWGVDIGPGGRGAIYKLSTGNNPGVITPSDVFTTIPDIGDNGATPPAAASSTAPNVASREAFFKSIGKSGLGDIDLSEDGKTLYVVNLYTRSLVSVQINADGTAGQHPRAPHPS